MLNDTKGVEFHSRNAPPTLLWSVFEAEKGFVCRETKWRDFAVGNIDVDG